MSRKLLLKGGLWLTAGNALSSLASFLRNVLIARFVSVEDFGIASLLALTMSIVEMASNLAIDRLVVQAPDGNSFRLQATGQAFQVARGLLGGIALFIAARFAADFFKVPHATWAFQVLALVPIIRGFVHLDITRYQREMHFAPSVLADVLPQIISLAIAVPLAIWLRDYSVMVWIIIAQSMLYLLFSYTLAERPYQWAWDNAILSRMISFGWPLLINGLLMFIIFQGDKAIVGAAFSMEVLGWYSAAFMLTLAPAMLVTKVAQSLLLPILSKAQRGSSDFQERFILVIEACLLVGLATGMAFAILGPDLLTLFFGSRYKDGEIVVIWLGLTQAVRIAKSGPMIVAIACAETKNPMLSNLVRGCSLMLALAAVKFGWGIVAIAASGLLGEIFAYGISFHLLRTRLGLKVKGLLVPVICFLSISVGFVFLGEAIRHGDSIFLKIGLLLGGIAVTVLVSLWAMPKTVCKLRELTSYSFDSHEKH